MHILFVFTSQQPGMFLSLLLQDVDVGKQIAIEDTEQIPIYTGLEDIYIL